MKRILTTGLVWGFLFLILPMKILAAEMLVPVGQVIGLQLRSDSLTVAAYDDTLGSHAREAGICIGDEIRMVDGKAVSTLEEIREALEKADGTVTVTLRRDGKQRIQEVPVQETPEGNRLGIYLRQGIAGIGTVTWYDPATGCFGALGHGVSGSRGGLMEIRSGTAFPAEVISAERGKSGNPGQLKGACENSRCGKIIKNTAQGVFGIAESSWEGQALPLADYGEIHTGKAVIRSTVQGRSPRDYSVEILKIYPQGRPDNRNFLIRVTDPGLLAATGGIVQGMSGSPIIQDGKLIGAVTHVCVK